MSMSVSVSVSVSMHGCVSAQVLLPFYSVFAMKVSESIMVLSVCLSICLGVS